MKSVTKEITQIHINLIYNKDLRETNQERGTEQPIGKKYSPRPARILIFKIKLIDNYAVYEIP